MGTSHERHLFTKTVLDYTRSKVMRCGESGHHRAHVSINVDCTEFFLPIDYRTFILKAGTLKDTVIEI
jgi:hypothetical protein